MDRRHFVATVGAVSLAGCTAVFGENEPSRLDLTVQNARAEPGTVRIVVVDETGTTYEDTSERIDSDVASAFDVVVGTSGRHP